MYWKFWEKKPTEKPTETPELLTAKKAVEEIRGKRLAGAKKHLADKASRLLSTESCDSLIEKLVASEGRLNIAQDVLDRYGCPDKVSDEELDQIIRGLKESELSAEAQKIISQLREKGFKVSMGPGLTAYQMAYPRTCGNLSAAIVFTISI